MNLGTWALAAVLGFAALPARAENVPVGVYDCFGPELAGGQYLHLNITSAKFSVLSPGVYRSRAGKTGHFRFDGFTLSMVDGPYTGLKFHKASAWSFRLLRDNGDEGPFMCPLNTSKDPNAPNNW